MVLHPHRHIMPDPGLTEPGAEHAGVFVAAVPVARMVRGPAEPEADVAEPDMARQPPQQRRFDRIAVPRHGEEHRHREQLQQHRVAQRLARPGGADPFEHALVMMDRSIGTGLAVEPGLDPGLERARRFIGEIGIVFVMVAVIMVMQVHHPRHREREDQDDRADLSHQLVPEAMFRPPPPDIVVHRFMAGDVAPRGEHAARDEARP